MPLPEVFVWTRFGTEAGQSIEDIIQRKERERRDNDGLFLWGIGNNIAPSLSTLLNAGEKPIVAFSPIKSKPRTVDKEPGQIAIWRRALCPNGTSYDLPAASLVTSRYVHGKSKHFALICRSDSPLSLGPTTDFLNSESLVNAKSGVKVGFSQVTAVVKNTEVSTDQDRSYSVVMCCELAAPFVAVLHDPIIISELDRNDLGAALLQERSSEEDIGKIGQLSLQFG